MVYHNGFETGAGRKLGMQDAKLVNLRKLFDNLHYYDASFRNDFTLQSIIGHFDPDLKARLEGLHVKDDNEAQLALRYEQTETFDADLEAYSRWWIDAVHKIVQALA